MTQAELKAKLKGGSVAGFYIFGGEEDYLKTYYRKEIKKLVCEDEVFETFNYQLFEGDDVELASIKEALYAPPMMSDYKMIEWRHADLDGLRESERDFLIEIAEAKDDYPYATLVICARADGFETTEKKPSKLHTKLKSAYDVIIFDKSTDAQLIAWLKKHFDREGIKVTPDVLGAMLFRVGHSMEQLCEEVIKLSSYVKANGRDTLSLADVEEVTSSTVECDAFAISNAIIEKNMEKAFLALSDMKGQRVEPYVVLAQLSKTYGELVSVSLLIDEGKSERDIAEITKIHPYRLSLYVRAAKKTGTKKLADSLARLVKVDGASKMGGITGFGAIEMFITQNI